MQEFLVGIFGELWSTLFMSIIPLIELKGGIIYARSVGYSFFEAYGLSYLGSTIAFFPVFFLFIPILNLLKKIKFVNNFAQKIEAYIGKRASDALEKQKSNGRANTLTERKIKFLTVLIFVAIPLPMTGVWTGTAIAVFLQMKFKDSLIAVVIGNLVAGLIISLLGALCIAIWDIESLNYVLWGLFILAIVLLVITIIKITRKNKKVGDN
ncbi:MAG: small multi-drug export protein [Clostridia bacterium]|nr:small multi-drug export protein [Clostridia bacterium]